jgi:hypothetical protein
MTWLAGRGWTVDASATEDDGWRAHAHTHGLYVNLRAAMSEKTWNYWGTTYGPYGAGNGTIALGRVGAGCHSTETFTIQFSSATNFTVTGNAGSGAIGSGVVGTPFTSKYVNFTITAGGTNFTSASWFTVSVTIGSNGSGSGSRGYGIGINAGTGYNAALGWNLQPGCPQYGSSTLYPLGAGMLLGSGSITAYHFMDDGNDNIVVLVEKTPGVYVHIGWGPTVVKHGYSWDAPYFFGSSGHYYSLYLGSEVGVPGGDLSASPPFSNAWKTTISTTYYPATTFVKVDSGEYAYGWACNAGGTALLEGYTGRYLLSAYDAGGFGNPNGPRFLHLVQGWPTPRSIMTGFPGFVLLPLWAYLYRTTVRWSPLGYPPHIFYALATQAGIAAGSVVAVGGVNYLVAPNFVVKKV